MFTLTVSNPFNKQTIKRISSSLQYLQTIQGSRVCICMMFRPVVRMVAMPVSTVWVGLCGSKRTAERVGKRIVETCWTVNNSTSTRIGAIGIETSVSLEGSVINNTSRYNDSKLSVASHTQCDTKAWSRKDEKWIFTQFSGPREASAARFLRPGMLTSVNLCDLLVIRLFVRSVFCRSFLVLT